MFYTVSIIAAILMLVLAGPKTVIAEGSSRWNLSLLYTSEQTWDQDFQNTQAEIKALSAILGNQETVDATLLASSLNAFSRSKQKVAKLYSYASLRFNEDMRQEKARERLIAVQKLHDQFLQKNAILEREIALISPKIIENLLTSSKALKRHVFYLKNIVKQGVRSKNHDQLRSARQAQRIALSSFNKLMASGWPVTTLTAGNAAILEPSNYNHYLTLPNRSDRAEIASTFTNALASKAQYFAVTLKQAIIAQKHKAQALGYDMVLHEQLSHSALPKAAVTQLSAGLDSLKPLLHRYFAFKAAYLGVPHLEYYDITAGRPTREKHQLKEAQAHTLTALSILGSKYIDILKAGFSGPWMDAYPRMGKRIGAYTQDSAYGHHPYLAMNFSGRFSDVGTFAHEWGHAVHSILSQQNNPYETSRSDRLTAEIVAATNEILLQDYLIDKAQSPTERLYYTEQALLWIYRTFYVHAHRTTFAQQLHELITKDVTVTSQNFNALYLATLREYYASGMTIPEAHASEWALASSYYEGFGDYNYAAAAAAGTLMAQNIKGGQLTPYFNLLEAGGSDYAHNLLKGAGIDLTSPAPYDALSARLEKLLKTAETLVAKIQN